MKMRRLLLFCYCCCLIGVSLQAQQRFKAGIVLGVTAAQINGDDSAEFNKLGFTGGLRAITILSEKSDVLIELLYSQRGSQTALSANSVLVQQVVHLDYIEVPILFNYKDWLADDDSYHKLHFHGGLSYGRLLNSRFEDSPLEEAAPFFRENDFGWAAGVTFFVNKNVGFSARYTRSINLLFKSNSTNPNVNSLLSYFLSFSGNYIF